MEHNFFDSLKEGHKYEDEILDVLSECYNVRKTIRNVVTTCGDAWLKHIPDKPNPFNEDREFLIELKQDCLAASTGFTVHEVYRKDKHGNITPSGLSKTEAKYYVYGYAWKKGVWFIATEKLKRLIEDGVHHDIKDFTGDGKKETSIARFRPEVLHGHSTHLFNRVITVPKPNYQ